MTQRFAAHELRKMYKEDGARWRGSEVVVRDDQGNEVARGKLLGWTHASALALGRGGENVSVSGGWFYGFENGDPVEYDESHVVEVL